MNKNNLPKFNDMFLPFLEKFDDGREHSIFEIEEYLANKFKLTKEQREIIKQSGGERLFLNKLRWVKTHLTLAKLIQKTKTNHCKITQRGKEVLGLNLDKLTETFLKQFKEYAKARGYTIKFSRVWAMPNKWTFKIQPISEILDKHNDGFSVDPFSGMSEFADLRNDLNPDSPAHYHKDAIEFLESIEDNKADLVIYDPPYSPRQLSESYKNIGRKVTMQDTQQKFWSKTKDQCARITKLGGKVICMGWNSNGLGEGRGFELQEINLIPHGAGHNDTIITVEKKVREVEQVV